MTPQDLSDVLCPYASGVRLSVRAKPGTSRARAIRLVDIGDGKRAIEVSVAAAASEGKANRALIDRLAEACGVKKQSIEIATGETSRLKIIRISGEPSALRARIASLLSR